MGGSIGPIIILDGMVSLFDTNNQNNKRNVPLIYDTSIWENGSLPGTPFGKVGVAIQTMENHTDPWGNTQPIWKTTNGTGSQYGGIYMSSRTVNPKKLYRLSYWENRVFNGPGETYGRHYFGCNGYGSPNGIGNLSNTTPNTNPYFWSTSYNRLPINSWFLISGHIHPYTYTSTDEHPNSGRWNVDGTKIGNISTDYRMFEGTTSIRPRSLTTYYAKDTTSIHHSLYPRMDVVDGTEPSIDDLLHNRTHRMVDAYSKKNIFVNKSCYDNSKLSFNNKKENTINLGDVGVLGNTFSIGAWVYSDSFSSTYNPIICRDGNTNNNFSFGFNTNGSVKINQLNGTSFNRGSCSVDTWYHIVVSINNLVGKLYINGVQQGVSFTFTNSFNDTGNIKIGTCGSYYYNGNVNLSQIYNRGLNNDEINQNFNSTRTRFI